MNNEKIRLKVYARTAPSLVVCLTSYSGQQVVLLLELLQRPATESDQAPPYLELHYSSKPRVACLCHFVDLSKLPAAQDSYPISKGETSAVYQDKATGFLTTLEKVEYV